MSTQTPEEAKVTAWLAAREDAMIALLREMVDTDSGSYDKAGVDRAGQVLARFHESNGLTVEFVPDALPDTAKHLEDALAAAARRDAEVAALAAGATYAGDADPYRRPAEDEDEDGGSDAEPAS